jgi:hypothetical protein
LGDCLFWPGLGKLQKELEYWAPFFWGNIYILMLTKYGLGYILGDFFHKKHPVTLLFRWLKKGGQMRRKNKAEESFSKSSTKFSTL